jgi:hypothetical protein
VDFADNNNDVIRVVVAATGTFYGIAMTGGDIYAVAGDGHLGYSGDGGPGTAATVQAAGGLAFDHGGNLVIADTGNHVVRVVAATTGTFYGQAMTAGDIYTVAGDGGNGYSGDTGPATLAELSDPAAVAVDAAGNLLIADTNINLRSVPGRIRVVAASSATFYGQAMTGGLFTVAGSLNFGYSGDGGPAVDALMFNPEAVAVAPDGDLLITDDGNRRVREVTP